MTETIFLLLIKKVETLFIVIADQKFNYQCKYFLGRPLNHRLQPWRSQNIGRCAEHLETPLLRKHHKCLKNMARSERFELPTTWFEATYSFR